MDLVTGLAAMTVGNIFGALRTGLPPEPITVVV